MLSCVTAVPVWLTALSINLAMLKDDDGGLNRACSGQWDVLGSHGILVKFELTDHHTALSSSVLQCPAWRLVIVYVLGPTPRACFPLSYPNMVMSFFIRCLYLMLLMMLCGYYCCPGYILCAVPCFSTNRNSGIESWSDVRSIFMSRLDTICGEVLGENNAGKLLESFWKAPCRPRSSIVMKI